RGRGADRQRLRPRRAAAPADGIHGRNAKAHLDQPRRQRGMTKVANPVVRLSEKPLESWSEGALYAAGDAARLGDAAGLTKIGFGYSEVPPGKSGCPFHNHHVEDEMFVILEGEGTYRFGSDSFPFKAGDILVAPAGGQETAHQIINTGSAPLKFVS